MGDFELAEKLLLEAKEMDNGYVQTYVVLVSAYARNKDKKKREECINKMLPNGGRATSRGNDDCL